MRLSYYLSIVNLKKRFGARLQTLRKDAGWTQSQLAEKIGTSHEVISRIERGEVWVSAERLMVMAKIFKVPTAELFNFEEGLSERQTPIHEEIQKIVDALDAKSPKVLRRVRRAIEILLDGR